MSERVVAVFTRQFPQIAHLLDETNYRIEVTLHHSDANAPAVVIFKNTAGRGFGVQWNMARATLTGLRSRHFDAADPDDAPNNAAFLSELARRLSTSGATNAEVYGAVSWKWKQSSYHIKRALHRRAF